MARKKKDQTTEEITIETITTEPSLEAPPLPTSNSTTVSTAFDRRDYDILCADAAYFGCTVEERLRDLIISSIR